jgi:putative transposase
VDYIEAHRERFGVVPICRVLAEHGIKIAPSTFYDALRVRAAGPSAVQLRDAELVEHIARVHAQNFGVYGARKVWLQLNREGVRVARCAVEWLMKQTGLQGVRRGKRKRTTIADAAATRPRDLVQRRFCPPAPNVLWVADLTYVSTWSGWVYVAFVIDAYAQMILGWRTATSMTTQLVVDAVEHAIWTRGRRGIADLGGVIFHTDADAQYTSVRFTERLDEAGITSSVGSIGDSFDNALAETINGLYKTELIKHKGPWRSVEQVEFATAEWVDWFNHRRLYEYCGDTPPAVMEDSYYRDHQPHYPVGSRVTQRPDAPRRSI